MRKPQRVPLCLRGLHSAVQLSRSPPRAARPPSSPRESRMRRRHLGRRGRMAALRQAAPRRYTSHHRPRWRSRAGSEFVNVAYGYGEILVFGVRVYRVCAGSELSFPPQRGHVVKRNQLLRMHEEIHMKLYDLSSIQQMTSPSVTYNHVILPWRKGKIAGPDAFQLKLNSACAS